MCYSSNKMDVLVDVFLLPSVDPVIIQSTCRVLSRKFIWGGGGGGGGSFKINNEYGLHGRARSKHRDFAKSAWRDIIVISGVLAINIIKYCMLLTIIKLVVRLYTYSLC